MNINVAVQTDNGLFVPVIRVSSMLIAIQMVCFYHHVQENVNLYKIYRMQTKKVCLLFQTRSRN